MDSNRSVSQTNLTTNNVFAEEYIFDQPYVRIIFMTMYTVVFCLCFFGNLLVILVVILSRRLRSITNFFLANLAVADFCVGVFCVYQNLLNYLITDWILGDFLCKMYHFITSLSYTASIFILVVICTERYFAIIYAITCKQILTPKRLRLVIVGVWVTSGLYSSPKFFLFNTVINVIDGEEEIFCAPNRSKYNSHLFDMINFVLLYVIPLAIMSILYTMIAIALWKSSKQLEKQMTATVNRRNQEGSRYKVQIGQVSSRDVNPASSKNVLKARRGVIRMLVVVVLTFAVCNFPLHARKMWQYWSKSYKGDTSFSMLFTPLTFLLTYFNSAVNPLLYAFLSRNFRRGMREILWCILRRDRRHRDVINHQAMGMHAGIDRQISMRSSTKNNPTTTVTILHTDPSSGCSHEL